VFPHASVRSVSLRSPNLENPTRPRGHRPLFCFSVTSTGNFSLSVIAKRSRLSHRSMLGLVVDSAPRTVSLNRNRLLPSPSRSSTVSLRSHLCGMKALSPMMLLLSSPHIIRSLTVNQQIISHWNPFRDLKLTFPSDWT
jgi:hypothetical protein